MQIDHSEIVDYRWLAPQEALQLHAAGGLELPAPTFVTLLGFRDVADSAALVAQLSATEVEYFLPRLVTFDGGRCVLYGEDAGYQTLDMDTPGTRHRLVMQGTKFDYLRDF